MSHGLDAVETEQSAASVVKAAGADMLRGGAYKPRTSPYDFQGLGVEALRFLKHASRETGLPIVTEVMSETDVEIVADRGVGTGLVPQAEWEDCCRVMEMHFAKGRFRDGAVAGDHMLMDPRGGDVFQMVMNGMLRHPRDPVLRILANAIGVTDVEVEPDEEQNVWHQNGEQGHHA